MRRGCNLPMLFTLPVKSDAEGSEHGSWLMRDREIKHSAMCADGARAFTLHFGGSRSHFMI